MTRPFVTPTEHEVRTAEDWHDYCDLQGYPSGELCGVTEEEGHDYPPSPASVPFDEQVWAGLTWSKIRRALLDAQEPQQLDLLAGAAAG